MSSVEGYWAHDLPEAANDDLVAAQIVEDLGPQKLHTLQTHTSRKVFLFTKGMQANVAGFMQPGRPEINASVDHMIAANDNRVARVLDHEAEHFVRPPSLPLNTMSFRQAHILAFTLKTDPKTILSDTTWIEGCVEHETILDDGVDENVLYLQKEVPLYRKLCDLFKEHLELDFHGMFWAGREAEIVQRMADLADILELKDKFAAA